MARTTRYTAAVALVAVLACLWGILGAGPALTVALVVLVPVGALWWARAHPRGFAVAALTIATPVAIVWAASGAAGTHDTGVAWLTLVAFAFAAPLGAWLVPVRHGARWRTVAATDLALLLTAAVAPAAPIWTPTLAVLALVVPLVVQGWPTRRAEARA